MLDTRMLRSGQQFKELQDSYVIFITGEDYFGEGLPVYRINRKIDENGREFGDGSHIIYVNGSYEGDDPLGKLMHDFRCRDAKDMHYAELAEGMRYFKEEGGRKEMSEMLEEYAKEIAEEYVAEREKQWIQQGISSIILKMQRKGFTSEQISDITESIEAVNAILDREENTILLQDTGAAQGFFDRV